MGTQPVLRKNEDNLERVLKMNTISRDKTLFFQVIIVIFTGIK